jgi:FkbM family methyltransferase
MSEVTGRSGGRDLARRIEAPLRGARRRIVRALPADRRIKGLGGAKGRGWLQARRLTAPLLQWPVTLSTRDGLKLRVSADPVDEQIAQHVLGPHRTQYFPSWPGGAPHAPCILDVGAHHGLYAAAALHEYPGSRIVCVEPSAAARPLLRANLEINGFAGRARIVESALAPAAGESRLQHAPDGSWGYSLYEDAESSTGSEIVSLATLAEILDGARPEIVKCNAEGAEYSLIEQLERTDLRPALMIVMVHAQFGDMAQLLARAESMGYRVESVGWEARPAFQMWRDIRTS